MKQEKWFERKFNFENTQNTFPSIIERLSGTPIRLEEKLKDIAENILVFRENNTWSIKENIGHLIELEILWQGRFEDIINNEKELRSTDLNNTNTDLANHNEKPIKILFEDFKYIRGKTIMLIQNIEENVIFKAAVHPRLQKPMRTIDHFYFVAEHDDHHLARITQILTHVK